FREIDLTESTFAEQPFDPICNRGLGTGDHLLRTQQAARTHEAAANGIGRPGRRRRNLGIETTRSGAHGDSPSIAPRGGHAGPPLRRLSTFDFRLSTIDSRLRYIRLSFRRLTHDS